MRKQYALAAAVLLFVLARPACSAESFEEFLKEGKFYFDARLRYEFVEQDGLSEDAHAKTLRSLIGYKTGVIHGFRGVLEVENVVQAANDDYNDTLNGRADHPVVADIENTELNQGYIEYAFFPDTALRGGRQMINVDNHRFIGNVGWRQNNQTFDAATLVNKSIPATAVTYGYIYNVNRIFGENSPMGDFESDSHYYHIANTGTPLGTITAYGYLLDFETDSPANSSKTFGGSLSGKKALNDAFTAKYYVEYARQSDYSKNTDDYGAGYYHIAPALVWKDLTTTVGYEVLGSDGATASFRTPLATLHRFNGWADVFLTTPAAGLEDFYVDVSYKVSGLQGRWKFFNGLLANFQYHDFSAEDGGADYGKEWGIYLRQPLNKNMYAELKYADYNTDGFATDREKLILGLGVAF